MLPEHETCRFISPQETKSLLDGGNVNLIDVRTDEAYAEKHVPGSHNLCVYETAFPDKFEETFPDRGVPIVLMGLGAPFKADLAAYARLEDLDYKDLAVLKGGLAAWVVEGLPTEGNPLPDKSIAGRYALDMERSKIRWAGRNLLNRHDGTVPPQSGHLELDETGVPVDGTVTVDMTALACEDIGDSKMNRMLIDHLSSIDFFDTGNHPTASFAIQSASAVGGVSEGAPNCRVTGLLAARGQSVLLELDALVAPVDGGFVFQTTFSFDRTRVGALYGSGRVFERLGMHLVADLVHMDVTAVFKPAD